MSDALDSNLANCLNETHRVGVDHSIKSIETQLQNWAAIYMNFSDIESHHCIQEIQGVNKSDISNLLEKLKYFVMETLQETFDFINAEIQHGVLIPRVKNYLDSRIIDTRVKFLDFADFVETFRFCKEEINCLNNVLTDPTIDVNWISNWLLENSTIMYKKQLQNFLETEFPRRV